MMRSQNKDYTEARLLVFSNDFGVTVIHHQNADAMVLASALMRSIHPLIIFKKGGRPGGMPLLIKRTGSYWLGPWRQHFDDKSWRGSGYAFLAESTFCMSLFCDTIVILAYMKITADAIISLHSLSSWRNFFTCGCVYSITYARIRIVHDLNWPLIQLSSLLLQFDIPIKRTNFIL